MGGDVGFGVLPEKSCLSASDPIAEISLVRIFDAQVLQRPEAPKPDLIKLVALVGPNYAEPTEPIIDR
jgi:hypothetical protein